MKRSNNLGRSRLIHHEAKVFASVSFPIPQAEQVSFSRFKELVNYSISKPVKPETVDAKAVEVRVAESRLRGTTLTAII